MENSLELDGLVLMPMGQEHLDQAADLTKACFSVPWSRNMLLETLLNPRADIIAAVRESDGLLVGYVCLEWVLYEGSLSSLAVAPPFRGRGIGSVLLERAIAVCRERGLLTLTLEVRASNTAAIALYEKQGFRNVGKRPGYYNRPREDALLLTLVLK